MTLGAVLKYIAIVTAVIVALAVGGWVYNWGNWHRMANVCSTSFDPANPAGAERVGFSFT